MPIPHISREFTYSPVAAKVTNKVADNIINLQNHGIDSGMILDIYAESQRMTKNIKTIVNPYQYTSSFLGSRKGDSNIRFRDLEKAYITAVEAWNKIEPNDFLQQYDAYIYQCQNNSGIEKGFVVEQFLQFSKSNERLLVVDPPPAAIEVLRNQKSEVIFTFTDDRICNAHRSNKGKYKVEPICCLSKIRFNRVLIYAGICTQEDIETTIELVRPLLITEKETFLYVLLKTSYLEKRKSKPELWNYINETFTVQKISLIDQKTINIGPKKQCLLILQNYVSKPLEILVQKTRLVDDDTFATLEFRRIPFDSFANRDRTLSEMYNTDYVDYSKPVHREKPVAYEFSEEIKIWVSFSTDEEGKYRPYYSVYDYPTVEQLRKNTLQRGSAIQTRIPGKWYKTKEEALASAEDVLLMDVSLGNQFRKVINREFSDKPITMKTFVFLHWEALKKSKKFDEIKMYKVFFQPHSSKKTICGILIGDHDDTVKMVLDNYLAELNISKTAIDDFLEQIQLIYDYAVIDKRSLSNPVRVTIRERYETDKIFKEMRNALVNRSLAKAAEIRFVDYVIHDAENRELANMTLTKYFTHLSNSALCALTWKDYHYNKDIVLGQLSVTKCLPDRSQTIKEIEPEKRRFIPLVTILTEMFERRIANDERKSNNQPLFTQRNNSRKAITSRQLRAYINSVLEYLDLPEYSIPIFEEDKPTRMNDINRYQGDFLRSNFEYHAYYDALMEADEIAFIAGRDQETTESIYYCDYNNIFLQLIMRVKLDRWVASLLHSEERREFCHVDLNGNTPFQIESKPSNELNELCIEIDIADTIENEEILLSIKSKYGGSVCIEYFEED